MIYLAILVVLYNLFRGVDEGMTMYHGDIRDHDWFDLYHRISALPFLFAILIGASLVTNSHNIFSPSGLMILVGALILSWQVFESAYSYTRFRTLLPETENLFGLSIYVENVALVMIVRLSLSATLLIIGGIVK